MACHGIFKKETWVQYCSWQQFQESLTWNRLNTLLLSFLDPKKYSNTSRDIKGLRLLKGGWNVMQPATTIRLDTCWKFWNFHDDPTELKMEHLLQHHGLKHLRQLLVSKLHMQHLDMEQLWSAIPCYPSCFNFFYSVRCALRLALKRVWSLKFVTALTALLLILVLKYLFALTSPTQKRTNCIIHQVCI